MNPDDYKKVKEIFNSALEVEPEGRGAFLDERCDGENGLREEVERLLRSYDSEYLGQPAVVEIAIELTGDGLLGGQHIGHYTILEKIGSGGMGEVYLAEDGKLGRHVAIKLLPEVFTNDIDRLDRFQREARTASALNHPNILTIHEIGETDHTHYIATEYIDGETLRQKLNRGPLMIASALDVAVQVASALTAAHEAGIIHRDIKPENIMLRRDGLAKVLDFGLAKLSVQAAVAGGLNIIRDDAPTERHLKTAPGMIMGTVQYMSPEQARGHATDTRSDIWSFGCVLYEIVAGSPPFEGENSADLIAEIVKTCPKSLSERDPEIPERLDEIVAKTIEKDPDERYQTAKDLLIDLKRLKRRLGVEDVVEHSDPSVTTDPGNGALTGPNLINTKSGPKDLTTVRGTEYFVWGIKAHRVMSVGIGLLIAALLGGTVYLVRNYWKGPSEARIEYANKIRLAAQALDSSNLPLVKQILDETRPKNGEEDLRGFEWGYLARLHSERTASQPIVLPHDGWINGLAFSRDGNTIAAASTDARVWEVSTGKQIAALSGHSKAIASVAISPDGTRLATGSFDNTAKLWEISTGRLLWTVESLDRAIALGRLIFSPDGNTLYGEVADRKIKGWDVSTGAEVSDRITSLQLLHPFAWSADAKYVAGQSPDRWVVEIREVTSGRKVATLDGNFGFVTDAKFAPDSKSIVTSGSDGISYVWELPSGKQVRKFTDVTCEPALSPDGKTIAMCNKNAIKLWDVEKNIEIARLHGHTSEIKAISFSPDGKKLASGGGPQDNTVRIWNVPNETRGVLRGHKAKVGNVAFSNDGKLLASASDDKTAKIWEVETERERLPLIGHTDHVNSASFSPIGPTVVTASQDRTVKIWDVITGRQILSFDSLARGAAASYSPNGKLLATTHFWDDPNVRIWDATTGKLRCMFRADGPSDVQFSRDGRQITASVVKTAKRWNTETCAETWSFNGDSSNGYLSVFTPEGKLLPIEILNNDRSLKFIDAESGKELVNINGHETKMVDVDFSPNGKRLVTTDESGTLTIWDVATGQELLTIKTNVPGDATTFSPNGMTLAAAGEDGTIRLFRSDPSW